jgi:hypothetical protein
MFIFKKLESGSLHLRISALFDGGMGVGVEAEYKVQASWQGCKTVPPHF